MAASSHRRPWWEGGVVYQIYPRSFADANGDGVGDLAGIRQKLSHVARLGADAVWLSPIFPSPMADFGYDVADYCDVDPTFGTLAEFDALLAEAHGLGLKVLLDYVPNHSSDQHPWFKESRESRDSPRRDWYIWRDPAPSGGPPNNWTSDMGGSAWEFDPATGQYFLHAFLKEQPDLNWRNPAVREAMLNVLRFWFERGVDGFRIDVLWHCIKAEGLPDNPPNPAYRSELGEKFLVLQHHSANQPEIHELAHAFRALADGYGDRLLVGEICLPVADLVQYYGSADVPGVHLPFNFQLLDAAWEAGHLAQIIDEYDKALPEHGWPNWVMGSHDAPRIAARLGDKQARVAAMLLLTLRGTPTLYQGDELGIGQVDIPRDRIRDPQDLRQPGLNLGRDRSRTPMAWNSTGNSGFSSAEPWLPLHPDWQTRNVAAQEADPASMLNLYRNLLTLRRKSPALHYGAILNVAAQGEVLTYERQQGQEHLLIALNLGKAEKTLAHPAAKLLLSTLGNAEWTGTLAPDEGVILDLTGL